MWQDRKMVMIKELTWHRAQFKYGEEMSYVEKVKPKTEDVKCLNCSNRITHKFTIL